MQSKHFDLVLKEGIKNEFIVTAVLPDYVWENGVNTGKIKGWRLKTICPSANYDETLVKIESAEPPLDSEAVEKKPVAVTFTDLEFSSYYSNTLKKLIYQGAASGIKLLK